MRESFICPDPLSNFSWLPEAAGQLRHNPSRIARVAERCLLDGCQPPPDHKSEEIARRAVAAQAVLKMVKSDSGVANEQLFDALHSSAMTQYSVIGILIALFDSKALERMARSKSAIRRNVRDLEIGALAQECDAFAYVFHDLLASYLGRRGAGPRIDLHVKLGAIFGVIYKYHDLDTVYAYFGDMEEFISEKNNAAALLWLINFMFRLAVDRNLRSLVAVEATTYTCHPPVRNGIIPDANFQKELLKLMGGAVHFDEYSLEPFYFMEPSIAIGLLRALAKKLRVTAKSRRARALFDTTVFANVKLFPLEAELNGPSYYSLAAIAATCAPKILDPLRKFSSYDEPYVSFLGDLYRVFSRIAELYDFDRACKIVGTFASIPKMRGLTFGALYERYRQEGGWANWGDVDWLMKAGVKPSSFLPGVRDPSGVSRDAMGKSSVKVSSVLHRALEKQYKLPKDLLIKLRHYTDRITRKVYTRVIEWLADPPQREALFRVRKVQHPVFGRKYKYWDFLGRLADSDLEAGYGVSKVFGAATDRILSMDPSYVASSLPVKLPSWYKPIRGVRVLKTVGDYYEEGEKMDHCARTYIGDALTGKTMLAHVEIGGRPFTLEIDPITGKIVQMNSVSNEQPNEAERDLAVRLTRPWVELAKKAL